MAWPQQPQPTQPAAPQSSSGANLSIPALVVAISGVLTFFFSFVQIVKIDNSFVDFGASVWTTDFGLFGIGTWIPFFALVAGAAALVRTLVKGLDEREVAGFTLRQVQLVALVFAALVWLGYLVNAVLSEALAPALGMFLMFIGLAGVAAGTVMDMLGVAAPGTAAAAPGATPDGGQWPQQGQAVPTDQGQWSPPPAPQEQGQWPQQPAPETQQQWQQQPAPQQQGQWPQQPAPADQGQWQQQPAAAPAPDPTQWQQPAPDTQQQWQQPAPETQQQWDPNAAPGQWQPDPTGGTPTASPTDPQPWTPGPAPAPPGPQPEPGPLDPQPAPPQPMPGPAGGGALIDPGTQVIPGPPPAPPTEDTPDAPDQSGFPEPPPSNTP